MQDAGAFCVVLEKVAYQAAGRITDALRIPTIGIGSGPPVRRAGAGDTRPAGHVPRAPPVRKEVRLPVGGYKTGRLRIQGRRGEGRISRQGALLSDEGRVDGPSVPWT